MNKSQKRVKAAERRAEKHKSEEYKEHLTNWYMINLSWGILGIILLVFYGSLYKGSALLYMNTVSWVLTALFAVGGIALFALGKTGVIKNQSRACPRRSGGDTPPPPAAPPVFSSPAPDPRRNTRR